VNDLEFLWSHVEGIESNSGGGGERKRIYGTTDAYINRNMVERGSPSILPTEEWSNIKRRQDRATSQRFAAYHM
jgi:hypothetical protein